MKAYSLIINGIKGLFSNKLLSSSVVYTIINFINKGFPFLLLPILTRVLPTEDYGEYALFRATASILLPFIGFNLSEYIMKNYFTSDEYSLGKKVSLCLIINIVLCLLFAIIILFIDAQWLYSTLYLHKEYLLIAIGITFLTSINNIERNLLRSENNTKLYSVLVVGQTLTFFLGVMILFLLDALTLKILIYIELFAFLSFAFVSVYLLRKKYNVVFYFNKNLLKLILLFCTPLVVNSSFAYIFSLSDRFIIANKLDTDSVGIYNATFQLVSIIQILAVSFNTAWIPYLYSQLEQKIDHRKLRGIQFKVSVAFLIICLVFYLVLINSLETIVGSNYAGGIPLIKWLVIGNFFQFVYWLNSTILIYHKHNWSLVVFSFISMVISLGLNLIFLESRGVTFAAVVFCVCWFCLSIMTFLKSENILTKVESGQ